MTNENNFAINLSLDISATVIHAVAIIFAIFRLRHRIHTDRLWWDDYTIAFSALVDVVYVPLIWFPYAPYDSALYNSRFLLVRTWLTMILYFVIVWSTRISISLGIARVFPSGEPTRRFAIGLAVFFFFAFSGTVAIFSVICPTTTVVSSNPKNVICNWTLGESLTNRVVTMISDTLLVVTPLYTLWSVKLPRTQRCLVLCGFAASSLTILMTTGCTIFQFAPGVSSRRRYFAKFSYFESGINLIAGNLLVIITRLHGSPRRRVQSQCAPPPPPLSYRETKSDSRTHNLRETISQSLRRVTSDIESTAITPLTLTQVIMTDNIWIETNSNDGYGRGNSDTTQQTQSEESIFLSRPRVD